MLTRDRQVVEGGSYRFMVGLVGIPLFRDIPELEVVLGVTDNTGIRFEKAFTFTVRAAPGGG